MANCHQKISSGHHEQVKGSNVKRLSIPFIAEDHIGHLTKDQKPSTTTTEYKHAAFNGLPNIVIEEKQQSGRKVVHQSSSKVVTNKTTSTKAVVVTDWKSKTELDQSELTITADSVICGKEGSVRGVKNKVREALATFQQSTTPNKTQVQSSSEKGRVVVYTTTNGIVRSTYNRCLRVKTILATQLVNFVERDVFLQSGYLKEVRQRLSGTSPKYDYYTHVSMEWEDTPEDAEDEMVNGDPTGGVMVPQVFIDGRHLGGAARVEALNECGRLKQILQPYKSSDVNRVCALCGNYGVLVCDICKGSKKSPQNKQFKPLNFKIISHIQLRCTNCDENGLVRCSCKQLEFLPF